MKYSYTWLKELSSTKKSPKELAERLTMRAFELEDIKTEGKETQMEFSILPNRGHDALSHIGMAREICAVEGRKFHPVKSLDPIEGLALPAFNRVKVEIKDKKLCSRYIGAIIEGVKVGPSPGWICERLLVCGVKPINNIVDITNYVMLENGQPLHAFDTKKTTGNIIVRKAKRGEKIKLLDEKIYDLDENNLVITDSEKALALAGVMGGSRSSVTNKTTSIILESANFNSANIRKTRISHNIITESSYRFEREIDPNLAEMGAARAVELIQKYGGKNVKITAITDLYPKKLKPWTIKLASGYVNNLLGEQIGISRMKKILENLGISVKILKNRLDCEIPTRRLDLKTQEDLIEEISRIYGYENIKEQAPRVQLWEVEKNEKRDFENNLRDVLAGLGFSEVMNYSFYGADDIQKCNLKIKDHIEIANPLSADQQYLRWSLVPNIIKNIKLNLKNFSDVKIFEIGDKFHNVKGNLKEATVLVGAMADKSTKDDLFFALKSRVSALLRKIGYRDIDYKEIKKNCIFWHESRTADIVLGGKEIGRIGEVNPRVLQGYGIKSRVAVFGIRLSDLISEIGYPEEKLYSPISKFPIVERDISMFVGKDTKYADVVTAIQKTGGNLVKDVELFDIFEKEGKRSLALRLKIGSGTKTLTSAEIDAVMQKIISTLEKDLKVKVRK